MLTEAALSSLRSALSAHGLLLRGGFNFLPDDKAPPGPSGKPARAVLLIGNAGRRCGRTSPHGLTASRMSWPIRSIAGPRK